MEASVCVTMEMVKDALDQLRGAVMIVYPMGLPPYDPIQMEFEDKEDLSGTQVCVRVSSQSPSGLIPLKAVVLTSHSFPCHSMLQSRTLNQERTARVAHMAGRFGLLVERQEKVC